MEDLVSPRVLAKMIYAGTSAASFAEASDCLINLANLSISDERVRRACGHVADDLAELAGLHRTYVSSVERGERNISLENIDRLANALNEPMAKLMPSPKR